MYEVKQTHIKGASKSAKLQVGDMGLTFYSSDMKPLDSILYQTLRSWNSNKKELVLMITEGTGEKQVTVKTPDGDKLAQLMKEKAASLAVTHRARRASLEGTAPPPPAALEEEDDDVDIVDDPSKGIFGVGQTHLPSAPSIVRLQIDDEAVALSKAETEAWANLCL